MFKSSSRTKNLSIIPEGKPAERPAQPYLPFWEGSGASPARRRRRPKSAPDPPLGLILGSNQGENGPEGVNMAHIQSGQDLFPGGRGAVPGLGAVALKKVVDDDDE